MKNNPKKRRGILESFLDADFDDNTPLQEAAELVGKITSGEKKVCDRVSDTVCDQVCDKVSDRVTDRVIQCVTKISDTRSDSISHTVSDTRLHTISDTVSDTRSAPHATDPLTENGIYLSDKQLKIFNYILQNGLNGFLSADQISRQTKIPKPTIYKSLKKFRDTGILNYEKYQKQGRQGFTYSVPENVQIDHKDSFRFIQKDQTHGQTLYHTLGQTDPSLNSSSSSLYKEPTTPPDPSGKSDPDIENVLNTDPEFGYWRQKGLTARQIKHWMDTAGCGPHSILEYLRYCRFEMSDLDMENTRPVENVFNWFFRILEKSGAYPRPKDYRSFTEKQLENERKFAQEQEKQIQELRTLRQKKERLEQDKAFEEMMNNPESDLYKKCLANLSAFHKKRAAKKGKTFETAMRKEFEKISGEG